MTKAKKITISVVAAVLAALIITITVLSLVKANNGFNTDAKPYQAQITKSGVYTDTLAEGPTHRVVNDTHAKYNDFVKAYNSMTTYSIMRGITEGKWNTKAKLETVVKASDLRALAAADAQYLVTLTYAELQEAEIKVKAGTSKDEPVKIIAGDDNYVSGDKVAFKYTSVVLIIEENNFINDLTIYAFEHKQINDIDFIAYKLTVKANRIALYNLCKEIL